MSGLSHISSRGLALALAVLTGMALAAVLAIAVTGTPALAGPAMGFEDIAAQVEAGALSPPSAVESILDALRAAEATPLADDTRQALGRALEATLQAAARVTVTAEGMDIHPFPPPYSSGGMLTPWEETLSPTIDSYLSIYDRLAEGLAARGLSDALEATTAGLTVTYDPSQAEPGLLCRLRLEVGTLDDLAQRRATVAVDFGRLGVTVPSRFLADAGAVYDEDDPTVSLFIHPTTGDRDILLDEEGLPTELISLGIRVRIDRVVSGADQPPPYEGGGEMLVAVPLSWLSTRPAPDYTRLYWHPQNQGPWEYWPGALDAVGRLAVSLPAGDGTLLLLAPSPVPPGSIAPGVTVSVSDSPLHLDATPRIARGRVLLPLRAVAEALGAEVKWDAVSGRVTFLRGGHTTVIDVGGNVGLADGRRVPLDVPAVTSDGRVLVPLRFIAESLGASVAWDEARCAVQVAGG